MADHWDMTLLSNKDSCFETDINPFVTSGTCMSHLQIALSSLLGYQYPTSSPCCHLPWNISTPWNQSECIFPRNSRLQMLPCAMLCWWLSVVMYFSQFWVYFSEISVIGAFILSVLLFTMHLYVSCLLYLGNERDIIKNVYLSSCSARYSFPNLIKFEFSPQIFEKCSNIKFQ